MQKHQVKQGALLFQPGCDADAVGVIVPGTAVQLDVPVRIAQAQVGDKGIPREIVGKQPTRTGFDEGEFMQPLEEVVHLRVGEHFAQHRLGRHAHHHTRFQRRPVRGAGHFLEKSFDERLDDGPARRILRVLLKLKCCAIP